MTRKKFIRLAMSYGVQRNKAILMANEVSQHGSYEELYKYYKTIFSI